MDAQGAWIKVMQSNGIETMVVLDKDSALSKAGKKAVLADLKVKDNVKAEATLKEGHYVGKAVEIL